MMSLFRFLMALFVFGAFQSTLFASKEKFKKNLSSSQPSARQTFELSPEGSQYYNEKRDKAAAEQEQQASHKKAEINKIAKIIADNAPKIAEFHTQERVEWARLALEENAKKEARARETLVAKQQAAMAAIKRAEKKAFQALQKSNKDSSQRASTSKSKKKIEAAQDFEKSLEIAKNQETQQKQEEISDDEFLRISRETLDKLKHKSVEQPKSSLDSLAEEILLEPSPAPVQIQERPRRPKRIKDSQVQESMVQDSQSDNPPPQGPKQRRRPRVQQSLEELSVLTESNY